MQKYAPYQYMHAYSINHTGRPTCLPSYLPTLHVAFGICWVICLCTRTKSVGSFATHVWLYAVAARLPFESPFLLNRRSTLQEVFFSILAGLGFCFAAGETCLSLSLASRPTEAMPPYTVHAN